MRSDAFYGQLIANSLISVAVEEFSKSAHIRWSYDKNLMLPFLTHIIIARETSLRRRGRVRIESRLPTLGRLWAYKTFGWILFRAGAVIHTLHLQNSVFTGFWKISFKVDVIRVSVDRGYVGLRHCRHAFRRTRSFFTLFCVVAESERRQQTNRILACMNRALTVLPTRLLFNRKKEGVGATEDYWQRAMARRHLPRAARLWTLAATMPAIW